MTQKLLTCLLVVKVSHMSHIVSTLLLWFFFYFVC